MSRKYLDKNSTKYTNAVGGKNNYHHLDHFRSLSNDNDTLFNNHQNLNVKKYWLYYFGLRLDVAHFARNAEQMRLLWGISSTVQSVKGPFLEERKRWKKWALEVVMCREKAAQSACQNCHLNSIFMPHLASVSRCYFQEKTIRERRYSFSFYKLSPLQIALSTSKQNAKNTEDSLEQSKPLKRFLLWEDCKANTRNAVATVQIEKKAIELYLIKKATRQDVLVRAFLFKIFEAESLL